MKRYIGLLILFSLFLLGCGTTYRDYTIEVPIISVSRETHIEGSFFLGCGSINGQLYFLTYGKFGDGYTLLKVACHKAIIVEGSVDPHVTLFYKYVEFTERPFNPAKHEKWVTDAKLYVPAGTITREFRLE